ncbi:hypothetical protein QE152_g13248 [Popillia japonica]|uniref:Uncharacterized protein n=1 Tax=Popillia japonica TaxID=7064 RepID=A0AAW1LFY7_POPJA
MGYFRQNRVVHIITINIELYIIINDTPLRRLKFIDDLVLIIEFAMKGNSLKDSHNSPPVFFNEDRVRLQTVLAKERAAIWNFERNYHILALQERLELTDADNSENFTLTQRILTPNIDKALACAYKQCQHKSCVNKQTELVQIPNIDKALACAYKQCQHKSCVNKQTELVQIPPPPPGFLLPSGSCRCCVTYRNTNSECAPPIQDELDINGIIKEFKAATRIHEEYEYGFFNGSAVPADKERKFSVEITNKLLETSYLLFNILSEEVCFNDKLIKELCLRYIQSSKLRRRMSYTEFCRSDF